VRGESRAGGVPGKRADTLRQVSESVKVPLVVIAGPTGVGKTAVAAALARRMAIEVVSADSRQVYRGMDVATGKPSAETRRAVVHHLVDVADPDDRYQAARFRSDAAAAIEAIRERGRLPVVVGGTGLYVRALLRGLDPAPPADPAFRRELASIVAAEGRASLHARLSLTAPAVARRLHPNDHVRVVRALELARAGASTLEQERWREPDDAYDLTYFGLTMDREALAGRLVSRAAAFVSAGLRDEVERLLARGYDPALPSLQSIGYREFVRVVRGELDPAEALRLMQRDTVRYAKRQWTWFAREPGVEWIDVENAGGADGTAERIASALARGGVLE
jgi:tRNA dimethylallyltransferase